MKVEARNSEHSVGCSFHKQLHRISAAAILDIFNRLIATLIEGTNKRTGDVHFFGTGKMDMSWRREGEVAILLHWIVRRKKSREQNAEMQGAESDKQCDRFPAADHARSSVRMRGSARNRNRSASSIPLTKKMAESMTDPITTYTSRARIASSSNGPMPGQVMITSIKSEALRSDPREKPKREMSGAAAVGNAWRNRMRHCESPWASAART